jgi:hypothetical protein
MGCRMQIAAPLSLHTVSTAMSNPGQVERTCPSIGGVAVSWDEVYKAKGLTLANPSEPVIVAPDQPQEMGGARLWCGSSDAGGVMQKCTSTTQGLGANREKE